MKRKILMGVLCAEALACVLFRFLQTSFAGAFSAALAFPFEQIGLGLRSLSLSGGAGNAAAVVIYIITGLSPCAALLIIWKKRKLCIEDGLLVLLTVVLFAVLYVMVNPGIINALTKGAAGQSVGKAVLGGTAYSVLCGYFILRALRLFLSGGTEKLVRYMSATLGSLNALFVYLVFGGCFGGLLDSAAALRAGNTGNEYRLGASYIFLILQFIADALPYVFNICIVFAALRLLNEMRTDRYSAGTVAAAERVSRICAAALVTAALVNIGFNILQLLFVKSLLVVNGSVQIPVFSIAFTLAALLLTRLIAENKQLKDDIDMFI